MTVKELIEDYRQKSSGLPNSDYKTRHLLHEECSRQIENMSAPHDEIAAELAIFAQQTCDDYTLENARENDLNWWIIAAHFHPSPKYLDSACRILVCESNFIWHEGLLEILYDIDDERAIPSIEKVLAYTMSYDIDHEMNLKALEVLGMIGTPKACAIIKSCLKSRSHAIRRRAILLLRD
ncbi:MAG: HEAT repeat domain-containing protein [Anaerolineae bacterium]|nr:HEAT repeat domain-containing protein [Anaerolineae bacterium]